MGDPVTWTAIATAAAATAAGAQAVQSKQAADTARSRAKKQAATASREASELDAQLAGLESDEARRRTRDQALARARALAGSGISRRDTILTSPLGLPGYTGGTKQLLGA